MNSRVVFSGIQPSGNLHIGNYLGAMRLWATGQEDGLNIFCIVDMHAITVPQDPAALREKTLEVAGLIVAAGVDPEKSLLFIQSHNPDHANLGWVLNCYLSMGQMNRMTQFKEKSEKKDFVSVGLFDYPALMAVTVPQDPAVLREKTLEVAGLIVAAGVDPDKSLLFIQSHNPDHANLGWILNCYLSMGQMNRMTQFKEKSEKKDFVSVGLFDYPALMAADILLYDTTEVPVGDDQKQHVELTRDVAERFNGKYGETFVLPRPVVPKVGGRVMSLTDPTKKMSKSDSDSMGAVGLLDSKEEIEKKIMAAVTDSGREVKYDPARPGIYNLVEIYSLVTGKSPQETENEFSGKGYGDFKKAVSEMTVNFLSGLQERYRDLRNSGKLEKVLEEGAKKSYEISHKKLLDVYKKIGFIA